MTVFDLAPEVTRLKLGVAELRERVDYLTVAVGRGDPRFTRPEYANPAFDCDAFDAEWIARGRRVPSLQECLGEAA